LDDGETWTLPKRISRYGGDCLDGDNTVEGAMPALGKNGEIYVAWSGPKGLMINVSKDQGETWLKEEGFLFDHEGGWNIEVDDFFRCNGLPVFLSDHHKSSPHYGNLYLNWTIQNMKTGQTSVVFSSSTDNGKSWSTPTTVHKKSTKYNHFLTWFTIDPSNGNIHFVYYRKGVDSKPTDVVWAQSMDGGNSFKEQVISEKSFEPNPLVFFGDYLNIAARDNVVRPVWPRMDKGHISLWTAIIDLK